MQKEVTIRSLQDHVTTAREKLKQLVAEDKQDSGLDNDFSSSSFQDEDGTNKDQNNRSHNNRTRLKRSNSLDSGDNRRYECDRNSFRGSSPNYKTNLYRRLSFLRKSHDRDRIRDLVNVQDYPRSRHVRGSLNDLLTSTRLQDYRSLQNSRFRDSLCEIEHELDTVDTMSAVLSEGLAHDLHGCHNYAVNSRSHAPDLHDCVVCSRGHMTQEIAGSIVRSLDLDDNSDTYSFLSAHLSNSSHGYENGGYLSDLETSMSIQCSSQESLSTLGNDKYYPGTEGGYEKKRKRRKRFGRRNSWKREAKPKIYIVQMPQEALPLATSGVAVTRLLNNEGTIV